MRINNIARYLHERFGDPIGSYAGDAPVGVRDEVGEMCIGCGLPVEDCTCQSSGTCPVCGLMPVGGKCSCSGMNEGAAKPCDQCGMLEIGGTCECGMAEEDENMKPCDECGMLEVEGSCGCTHMQESKLQEVAPKGYEKIVKALKKSPSVENPWALSWWMKGKGIKPKKKGKKNK